jgi:hypothetical protein
MARYQAAGLRTIASMEAANSQLVAKSPESGHNSLRATTTALSGPTTLILIAVYWETSGSRNKCLEICSSSWSHPSSPLLTTKNYSM